MEENNIMKLDTTKLTYKELLELDSVSSCINDCLVCRHTKTRTKMDADTARMQEPLDEAQAVDVQVRHKDPYFKW